MDPVLYNIMWRLKINNEYLTCSCYTFSVNIKILMTEEWLEFAAVVRAENTARDSRSTYICTRACALMPCKNILGILQFIYKTWFCDRAYRKALPFYYFMQIDHFLGKGKKLRDDRKEVRRTELKTDKMESKRLSVKTFRG